MMAATSKRPNTTTPYFTAFIDPSLRSLSRSVSRAWCEAPSLPALGACQSSPIDSVEHRPGPVKRATDQPEPLLLSLCRGAMIDQAFERHHPCLERIDLPLLLHRAVRQRLLPHHQP